MENYFCARSRLTRICIIDEKCGIIAERSGINRYRVHLDKIIDCVLSLSYGSDVVALLKVVGQHNHTGKPVRITLCCHLERGENLPHFLCIFTY